MTPPSLKSRLEEERRKLRTEHRHGAGGFELSRRLCDFWDRVLVDLFRTSGAVEKGLTLLATGSLGRRQLSPWSDVDFLLLLPDDASDQALEPIAESILYPLWDAGVKTGHQTRTPSECLLRAGEDPQILTALLDARFLAGDEGRARTLSENVDLLVAEKKVSPHVPRKNLPSVEEDYPPSVHILEPNVKESPGGLRDYQIAVWTAQLRFGRENLSESLIVYGLMSRIGWLELQQALDFLLRLRHELHFRARGYSDKLFVSVQPEAAILMGYQGAGEAEAAKALLKDYFSAAGRVDSFVKRVSELSDEVRTEPRDDIIEGAKVSGGMLHLPSSLPKILGNPASTRDAQGNGAIFDLFSKLAGTGLYLSERSRQNLSPLTAVVNDEFRENESAAAAFLSLLKKERAVDALRALHSIGLLDAYIPQFGAMNGLVPYDVFHSYPADVHTLLAMYFFDNLRVGMGPDRLVEAARSLARPDLLRLSILLHDTGKVGGPGHVDRGARMAPVVCLRLGLTEEDTSYVVKMVREHESLSHAAHTRDVEDPDLCRELAGRMADADGLRSLWVLTYCDMRAVGPGVWTDWRAGLIEDLFRRTLAFLTEGSPEYDDSEKIAQIEKAVAGAAPRELIESYLRQMKKHHPSWLSPKLAERHLRTLDLYHREGRPLLMIFWEDPDKGGGQAVACAPDKRGFLANIAGLFAAERLNIQSVEAFGTEDGLALDTVQFVPRDHISDRGKLESRLSLRLSEVVSGATTIEAVLQESEKRFVGTGGSPHVATEVRIDNHCSKSQTVVEVWTADRTGLLYHIAKALYDFGLFVTMAKVNTIAGRAVDSFYVIGEDGGKITGKRAQKLRFEVQHALAQ